MADAKNSLGNIKKQIRALLQSVKRGCTFKQLYVDYRHVMGYDVPLEHLGYSSFSQLIRDIPDVVEIRTNRDGQSALHAVADEHTEHISRLVSKQKSRAQYTQPPPARKQPPRRAPPEFSAQLRQLFCCYPQGIPFGNFNDAYARRFGRFLRFQPWGYSSLEQLLREMDGVELVSDPLKGSILVKPKRKNMSLQLDKKVSHEYSLNALETSPVKEKSVEKCLSEAKERKEPTPPTRPPPVPDRLIKNVRELLQAHPAGIWLSQFSAQYKEYYGDELPVFTQGYSTPLHLLASLPHVISIERPHLGNGDWLVAEIGAIVKVAPNHAFVSSAYISDELRAVIHRILAPAPDGVMLNSFLRAYKEETGKELEIRELGFNTLVQLLERVEGVVIQKPPEAGFMMVYGPRKKGRRKGGGGGSCGESTCSSESEEVPRPPGSLASAYTKQLPPKEKMFGVYVTHVHTPSCLCVQIIGETTTRTLEYLLEDLSQFYNSTGGDSYMLKKPIIGQPCCTLFNNDGYWYRAEVVGMPTSDIAEVLYVDYGNTGRVPATSLRRPKPHYITLPAQAIKCRLAHLKPAGSRWSTQASRLLFQMTKDKPIVAVVSSIVDGLISATLCDTTTDEDIHINDTLVSQGLAIFVKDTEEEERKYDGYQPEPLPLGATENIPDVRVPSSEIETPPTATPTPTTSSTTPLPAPTPTLTSSLPTPPLTPASPTPAPPGLTTSQITAPLMQNYLLNLFLQQACVPSMTGLPPSSLAQLLTGQSGFNFPFTAPQPETATNPVATNPAVTPQSAISATQQVAAAPKPPQTSLACSHELVKPVDSVRPTNPVPPLNSLSSSTDNNNQAPPAKSQATPTNNEASPTKSQAPPGTDSESEKEDTKEWRPSNLPKMKIKKCQLTRDQCLHVLQFNSRAYVLSPQVSEWFWDTDLLQSMLRQVQNARSVWGLVLQEHRAKDLFREMKKDPQLRSLLYRRHEVTIYALEDLPTIVSAFHAPSPVCNAVRMECDQWLKKGLDYFTDPVCELEAITTELEELRFKRKEILNSLEVDGGGDGDIDKGIQALTKVTKAISKVKKEQAMLLAAQSASHELKKESELSSSLSTASFTDTEHSRVASQASDYDDPFYTCASGQSSPTPTPEPPDLTPSQALPTYSEPSAACPSHINLSPCSLSSLSDSALSNIPHLQQRRGSTSARDTSGRESVTPQAFPYLTGARDTPVQREEQTNSVAVGKHSELHAHSYRNMCKPRLVPLHDEYTDTKPVTWGKTSVEGTSPTKYGVWKSPLSAFQLNSAGSAYSPVSDAQSLTEHGSREIKKEVKKSAIAEPVLTPSGLTRIFRPERVALSSGCGADKTAQTGSTGFTRCSRSGSGVQDKTCYSGTPGFNGDSKTYQSSSTGSTGRSMQASFTGSEQGRPGHSRSTGHVQENAHSGDRDGFGRGVGSWGSSGQGSPHRRRRGGRGNPRNRLTRPNSKLNQPGYRTTGSERLPNKETSVTYSGRRVSREEDQINCSSSEGLSSPSELVPRFRISSQLYENASSSVQQSRVVEERRKTRIPPVKHQELHVECETWDTASSGPAEGEGATREGSGEIVGRGREEVGEVDAGKADGDVVQGNSGDAGFEGEQTVNKGEVGELWDEGRERGVVGESEKSGKENKKLAHAGLEILVPAVLKDGSLCTRVEGGERLVAAEAESALDGSGCIHKEDGQLVEIQEREAEVSGSDSAPQVAVTEEHVENVIQLLAEEEHVENEMAEEEHVENGIQLLAEEEHVENGIQLLAEEEHVENVIQLLAEEEHIENGIQLLAEEEHVENVIQMLAEEEHVENGIQLLAEEKHVENGIQLLAEEEHVENGIQLLAEEEHVENGIQLLAEEEHVENVIQLLAEEEHIENGIQLLAEEEHVENVIQMLAEEEHIENGIQLLAEEEHVENVIQMLAEEEHVENGIQLLAEEKHVENGIQLLAEEEHVENGIQLLAEEEHVENGIQLLAEEEHVENGIQLLAEEEHIENGNQLLAEEEHVENGIQLLAEEEHVENGIQPLAEEKHVENGIQLLAEEEHIENGNQLLAEEEHVENGNQLLAEEEHIENGNQLLAEEEHVENGIQLLAEEEHVENGIQLLAEEEHVENGIQLLAEEEHIENGIQPLAEEEHVENGIQPLAEEEHIENGNQLLAEEEHVENEAQQKGIEEVGMEFLNEAELALLGKEDDEVEGQAQNELPAVEFSLDVTITAQDDGERGGEQEEEDRTNEVDDGEKGEEVVAVSKVEEKPLENGTEDVEVGALTSTADTTLVAEGGGDIEEDDIANNEGVVLEVEQEFKAKDSETGFAVTAEKEAPEDPLPASMLVVDKETTPTPVYQENVEVESQVEETRNDTNNVTIAEEGSGELGESERVAEPTFDQKDPTIEQLETELPIEVVNDAQITEEVAEKGSKLLPIERSKVEEVAYEERIEEVAQKVEEFFEEVKIVSPGLQLSGLEEWCTEMEKRGCSLQHNDEQREGLIGESKTVGNGNLIDLGDPEQRGELAGCGERGTLDAGATGPIPTSDLLVDISVRHPVVEEEEDTSMWPLNIKINHPLENSATNSQAGKPMPGDEHVMDQQKKRAEGPETVAKSKVSNCENTEPRPTHHPRSPPKSKHTTFSLAVTRAFKPKYPLSAPLPSLLPLPTPPVSHTVVTSSLKVAEEFVPAYPRSSSLPPLPLPSHSPSPYSSPSWPPATTSPPLSLPLITPPSSPSPSVLSPPSPSLPLVYPSSQPQPFIPDTVKLRIPPPFYRPTSVEWASERLVGLGRGSPENNPRAFMLPGYPEIQPYRPERIVYNLVAPTPRHCPGTWQVLESQPQ